MAGDMSLKFNVFGKDVSGSSTLKHVGSEAKKTGDGLKGIGSAMAGVFGGLSLQGVAQKVTDFGKETIDAFSKAAGETRTLQRYLGGTAEDASRLRVAGNLTGTSIDTLASGMGKMSKFAYAGAIQMQTFQGKMEAAAKAHKPFHGALGKNAALFKQLSVDVVDSSGKMRSTESILMDLSDRFKGMPNGVSKTALIMQVFGRNGMQMLPFLNKGADGIKKLGEEADKTGQVMSTKDLKSTMDVTKAKRELHDSVEGLQIAVGRELYPIMGDFAKFLGQKVIPALHGMFDFFNRNKGIILPLAAVIGGLVGTIFGFVKVMQIVTAVQEAWNAVQAITTGEIWATTAALLANPMTWIVLGIMAVIGAVVLMCTHWTQTKEIFGKVWGAIKDAGSAVFDWLKGAFRVVGDIVLGYVNIWINGINLIFDLLNKIPHVKMFGYDIGFNLPKLQTLSMDGIFGSSSTPPVNSNGGVGSAAYGPKAPSITINVAGHVTTEHQLARVVRDHIAQGIRRRGLSPATLGV